MSYKPWVTRANSGRRTALLDTLTLGMSMRSTAVSMAGQVALCIMCRNPVATAAPDYPRFMGAPLIDGMAITQSRIHAAMGHRDLTLGGRIADRARGMQVALAHRPPVRKHAVSSTFICIKRHFQPPVKGAGFPRRLPALSVSAHAPDRLSMSRPASADPPHWDGCRTRTCQSGWPPTHRHWVCRRHHQYDLRPERIQE